MTNNSENQGVKNNFLNLIKKNKGKFIIVALCVVLTVILILILTMKPVKQQKEAGKEGKEVNKILLKNEYKTYFTYGGNDYNSSLTCYKYDYSEKADCQRETKIWDFISIDIVNDSNKNITFGGYVTLDENDKITDITLNIKEEADDSEKYKYLEYTISSDGKEDYYSSMDKDYELCYVMNNSFELKEEDTIPCSKSVESDINKFKKEYKKIMKEMDLSYEDFFNYFEWYANEYSIPQYKKAKEELKNKMPYASMLKKLSKEYEISIEDNQVILIDYTSDYRYSAFSFLIEDGKVDTIGYASSSSKDYYLGYDVEDDYFKGKDTEGTCLYILGNNKSVLEQVDEGKYCNENDKTEIRILKHDFEFSIENIELTLDEMISFAEEYYSKNK